MDNTKIGIIAGLIIVVAMVLAFTNSRSTGNVEPSLDKEPPSQVAESETKQPEKTQDTSVVESPAPQHVGEGIPRLVDLGANTCRPCKMMAPILKELAEEYEGRMIVEVIDVRENPDAGQEYRISVIPTQIFYDASGKELDRHSGFISKEDILARWKKLGYDFSK